MKTEKLAKAIYFLNANYKNEEIEKIEKDFVYFKNGKFWSIDVLSYAYNEYIKRGYVMPL